MFRRFMQFSIVAALNMSFWNGYRIVIICVHSQPMVVEWLADTVHVDHEIQFGFKFAFKLLGLD